MKKVLTVLFLTVFVVANVFAQNKQKHLISGKILDSISMLPLEYATITIVDTQTQEISGTISDKNGGFKIYTHTGNYALTVDFLSYEKFTKHDVAIIGHLDLGTVILSPKTEALGVIEINGKQRPTTIKLGKTVYNVEQDIAAQGGSINDILNSAPTVSVINGIPSIRGSNATVLINGRVTSMSKPEALENLQASSIKKIEIITTPSAKNRGDSNGGIINIILKKGIDNGWNGSLTGTVGIKNVHGGSATLNYRKGKFNFYSNTSLFHRERIGTNKIENEYFSNDITDSYLHEDRMNIRKTNVLNSIFGIDYAITEVSSINVEGNFANFNGSVDRTNIYNFSDSFENLTSSHKQFSFTDHHNDIFKISTTYENTFDGEGKNLTLSLSHANDMEYNDSKLFFEELFPNPMPLPEEDELIYDDLDYITTKWSAMYSIPIKLNSNLSIGTQGDLGEITSDFRNEVIFDGDFVENPLTSNKLNYTENIFSLIAEFESGNDTFSYLLGLRSETTFLDMDFTTVNRKRSMDYTDLLPTAIFEYSLNDSKSLSLSYVRGIVRASYPWLNPFEQRISETTSFKGNLNLLPFYSNSIELSLLNSSEDKKITIKPSFYFRNYDDIWQYITVETGEIINGVPKLITTPINLGHLNFTGIELLANYNLSDKLNFTGSVDGRYVDQRGYYEYTDMVGETIVLDYDNLSFSGGAKLSANITFGKDYHFQTIYNYNFITEGAYSERYAYGFLNASFGKDILGKAGSITVSANDILNTDIRKRLRWTDSVNSLSESQWKEPSFLFTFTYRFNQSKKTSIIDFDKKDYREKN